jgi:hypothetical protein
LTGRGRGRRVRSPPCNPRRDRVAAGPSMRSWHVTPPAPGAPLWSSPSRHAAVNPSGRSGRPYRAEDRGRGPRSAFRPGLPLGPATFGGSATPDFTSGGGGGGFRGRVGPRRPVAGPSPQRSSSPPGATRIRRGAFAPRALPRSRAQTPPSDCRPGRVAVIGLPPPVGPTPCPGVRPPDRVSQVPRRLRRRPPSPPTPGGPAAARARRLAAGIRRHLIRKDGHSHVGNEAGPGSRFRLTADALALPGSDGEVARAAGSASWGTSSSHGQYLSTDKVNQAS